MMANRATAILLLACTCAAGQVRPTAQDPPTIVRGRVLSSTGNPLANAVVSLLPQHTIGEDAATAESEGPTVRTDADGRYHFDPQPAGRYTLQASARGYIPSLYQQHNQYSTAIVLGAGLQTDALDIRLTKNGAILGRVIDGYGDPVVPASLTLFRKRTAATAESQDEPADTPQAIPFRNAVTDGTGAYEFNPLPPGTYYLQVTATPWYAVHPQFESEGDRQQYRSAVDPALDVAYPSLFYPHALQPAEAATLEIKGGERTVANLQMQAEHALTLTITFPPAPPGEPSPSPQLVQTVFGVHQNVSQQTSMSDGRLQITGLVAGHYTVQAFVQGIGAVPRGNLDLVSSSSTLALASIETASTASASIHVQTSGGAALPTNVQVRLRGRGMDSFSTIQVNGAGDGMAHLAHIPAGTYRIELLSRNARLAVVAIHVDGQAAPDHLLHVGADTVDFKVAISASLSATRLTGTVQRNGEPLGGAMVVLVPAGAATAVDLYRRDQSDLDGSFTLRGVAPGKYLLLAVEDGWTLPWTDITAMARYLPHAIPVVIGEGAGSVTPMPEAVPAQPR